MKILIELENFLNVAHNDCRIAPVHISLFVSIIQYWSDNDQINPICIFSHDLMKRAKISGISTYCKSIRELSEYGYIKYEPSYNRFKGSYIYINTI